MLPIPAGGGGATPGEFVAEPQPDKPKGGRRPQHLLDFAAMDAHGGVVKLKPDLAKKLRIMVGAMESKTSIADILDPHIRPVVEAMWKEYVKHVASLD